MLDVTFKLHYWRAATHVLVRRQAAWDQPALLVTQACRGYKAFKECKAWPVLLDLLACLGDLEIRVIAASIIDF
jgi:hypothetical protein